MKYSIFCVYIYDLPVLMYKVECLCVCLFVSLFVSLFVTNKFG